MIVNIKDVVSSSVIIMPEIKVWTGMSKLTAGDFPRKYRRICRQTIWRSSGANSSCLRTTCVSRGLYAHVHGTALCVSGRTSSAGS